VAGRDAIVLQTASNEDSGAQDSASQEETEPTWVRAGGTDKTRRLTREILAQPSFTYPDGEGCADCVARGRICVIKDSRASCASCTLQSRSSTKCGLKRDVQGATDKKKRPASEAPESSTSQK
jgi:hypothetical protein